MRWPLVSLGELGQIVTGATPNTSEDGYFGGDTPFVTPGDLGFVEPILWAPRTLSSDGVNLARMLPAGAVLVTCIGASLGNVGIAGMSIAVNQQINAVVFDRSRVFPGYGFYACRMLRPALRLMAPATTMPIVSKSKFAKVRIPVPPLAEQKRIAAILDRVDALRAKRREAITLLDSLTQSIFLEMFGNPATNPKGWPLGTVGEILESATYGTSEKASLSGDVPVLRMGNVTSTGEIDMTNLKYLAAEQVSEKFMVRRGDVLFNRTNSAELVGKSAIYRHDESVACAGYLVRLRVDESNSPEYLAAYLNSAYAKTWFRAKCKSIVGMANINAKEVQAMRLALPPLELQLKFAESVKALESAKRSHRLHLATLDELFESVQQRAFGGQLWDHEAA